MALIIEDSEWACQQINSTLLFPVLHLDQYAYVKANASFGSRAICQYRYRFPRLLADPLYLNRLKVQGQQAPTFITDD